MKTYEFVQKCKKFGFSTMMLHVSVIGTRCRFITGMHANLLLAWMTVPTVVVTDK